MKKNHLFTVCLLLCGSFLTGCKTQSKVAVKENVEKNIVILFENDVHCAIEGYQKLAGLRDAIQDTAYVGVVSCGDYLQGGTMGAISTGRYVTEVMRTVGYDAVILGNHEFDYKIPRMMELLAGLGAPVVSCNLQNTKTKEFPFAPYVVKRYGNKKIAFIGATTPSARYTEEYGFVDEKGNELFNLSPTELPQLIQNAINSAREDGADYVILLSHLGEDPTVYDSDSHSIIKKTTGLDAVLDGHTHSVISSDVVYDKAGKPVLIAQTGTKFENVGKLYINKNGKLSTSLVPVKSITQDNPIVKRTFDRVNTECKNFTEKVIGRNDVDLIVQIGDDKIIRVQETNAGDLAADAIRDYAKTDISMMNAGGIRTTIPAGTLTYGKILDLAPYDNALNVVGITGENIVKLLTAVISDLPEASGDFPQVSGISFDVDAKNHTVSNVKIQNKQTGVFEPIINDKTYTMSTLDYTVSGGGFKGFLKSYPLLASDSKTLSDLIMRYVSETLNGRIGQQYSHPQGRINIK